METVLFKIGNALGDAFGLATEFMNKEDVGTLYPNGSIPFPNYIPSAHNRRWVLFISSFLTVYFYLCNFLLIFPEFWRLDR